MFKIVCKCLKIILSEFSYRLIYIAKYCGKTRFFVLYVGALKFIGTQLLHGWWGEIDVLNRLCVLSSGPRRSRREVGLKRNKWKLQSKV